MSKKELNIVSWKSDQEMIATDPNESIAKALKVKEALTNTGAAHLSMSGSPSDGGTSFNIILPEFISHFKREEGIIIKNLPDGLLNKDQKEIKRRILKSDIEKENIYKENIINKNSDHVESKEEIEEIDF